MGQGRGSAAVSVVMACLLVLQYCGMVHAAVYTVGDDQGWTFNVDSWPNQKRFHASDTLGNILRSISFYLDLHLSLYNSDSCSIKFGVKSRVVNKNKL